jgi:hypothetical protein
MNLEYLEKMNQNHLKNEITKTNLEKNKR